MLSDYERAIYTKRLPGDEDNGLVLGMTYDVKNYGGYFYGIRLGDRYISIHSTCFTLVSVHRGIILSKILSCG